MHVHTHTNTHTYTHTNVCIIKRPWIWEGAREEAPCDSNFQAALAPFWVQMQRQKESPSISLNKQEPPPAQHQSLLNRQAHMSLLKPYQDQGNSLFGEVLAMFLSWRCIATETSWPGLHQVLWAHNYVQCFHGIPESAKEWVSDFILLLGPFPSFYLSCSTPMC